MNVDILSTHSLLMAVEELTPAKTFLRDRYFPTNTATDVFSTNDVLVDYKDGNKKAAPFVAPRKEGVTVLRSGYNTKRFTPPYIAPRRALTIDDLSQRGFGEALFTQLTPEQRQVTFMMRDAEELGELISRREEIMAAETMLTGGCVMKHIAEDLENPEEFEIRFYDEQANPYTYTPTTSWDAEGADIMGDLRAMISLLTKKGLPASELVCAPDVASAIVENETIQKYLDIRRYELGTVDPSELPAGAALVAVLNVFGRMISIISYDETYTADDGTETPFIPAGSAILTAPAAGRTLYGAVTQLEQADGEFHTYTGTRIPKYLSSPENNSRTLTIKSRPLMMPNNKGAFISAELVFEADSEGGGGAEGGGVEGGKS